MKTESFRPYTQTHTLVFKKCRKLRMLLSQLGEAEIKKMFIEALEKSGFEIPKDEAGELRVQCHPFGKNFGYTATAILTSSDAAIHTYPEREFDRTMQVKFNLCYLWPATEATHNEHVSRALQEFVRITGSRYSSCHSSHPEYL